MKSYNKSDLFCTEELPKLKIKVESLQYDAWDIVQKLLNVSPDSPCSSDVLALGKRIGEQQLAKAAAAPDELNVLINIHEHHDVPTWRNRYD